MKNIFIYSRGSFEALPADFLTGKAIIRIHNVTDKKWYNTELPCGIELFFDDLKKDSLSFWEKQQAVWLPTENLLFFTSKQAKILCTFINQHQDKDFIIHCQYGRSRSVAVALFIKKFYSGKIANKEESELKKANNWVLELLEKAQQTLS